MAHTDGSLSREDRFIRRNKRLLLTYAAAFGLWQLTDMVGRAASGSARAIVLAASLGVAAGWTALLVLVVRNARLAKRDPAIRVAVQDERARDVSLRSYRVGFWSALASAALLGIPAAAHGLPAFAATRLVIVAGVSAFIGAYVFFDRE